MTRIQAEMELRRHYERFEASTLPMMLDTDVLLVFMREESEQRDYIFWRAIERSPGDFRVEQCYDTQTGTCSVCRVWLTPRESMESGRRRTRSYEPPRT